uniref:Putative ovule protein n=1 Tax=Solanum chacoense TaxID=4108 RepID=A0A0V0HU91_SOLCH
MLFLSIFRFLSPLEWEDAYPFIGEKPDSKNTNLKTKIMLENRELQLDIKINHHFSDFDLLD